MGGLSPNFLVVDFRGIITFQIWWRSVKGFRVVWGSYFIISHCF